MKVVEFKFKPSTAQVYRLNDWLRTQQYVWNTCVGLIQEWNEFNPYDKRSKTNVPASPCVSTNSRLKRSTETYGVFPSCPIGWKLTWQPDFDKDGLAKVSKAGDRLYIHPVAMTENGPNFTQISPFSLLYLFAAKHHEDKPWFQDCPSKITASTVAMAANAWKEFLKGNRLPPKFKSRRDPIKTLVNNNTKDVKIRGNQINLPKMGWVTIKSLDSRWTEGVPISTIKICKKPSGWYLQLTGDLPVKPWRPSGVEMGIDVGIHEFYTDDRGYSEENPRWLKAQQTKLKRLQRKAARQYRTNTEEVKSKEGRVLRHVSRPDWDRKNYQKTQAAIARCHEKIARQRRAFHHYHSTLIVRKAGAIAVEDLNLTGMGSSVKKGETGVHNGRKRKSALNRTLRDAAHGQFLTMVETKAKEADRAFVRVDPRYTSQVCPECGSVEKKANQVNRMVECSCGAVFHRDQSAALEIRERARTLGWVAEPKAKKRAKRKPRKESGVKEVKGDRRTLPQKTLESFACLTDTPLGSLVLDPRSDVLK